MFPLSPLESLGAMVLLLMIAVAFIQAMEEDRVVQDEDMDDTIFKMMATGLYVLSIVRFIQIVFETYGVVIP